MSKKRIILGILIVMVMAVCSAFIGTIPSVFATEITDAQVLETEAGKFYGQGYYAVGDSVTLKAEMNAGYAFEAWVSVDQDGNVIKELSTKEEDTFVVEENITIKAMWHKIEYYVNFDESLLENDELKDFTYEIVNKTQQDGKNYYNDQLEITVKIKDNVHIQGISKDVFLNVLFINGISLNNVIRDGNVNAQYSVTNDDITGFKQFVVSLNIKENLLIDFDYTYLYNLEIKSGNANIDIANIINFITATNYYSKVDDYNYLIRADKQVTLTISAGDDVYEFVSYQFQGQDPDNKYSQSFTLSKDSTFTVNYSKKQYEISFNSYLVNGYGNYDNLTTLLYDINSESISAGESVSFEYDELSKKITIKDITDDKTSEYTYPTDVFGYKFVGFAINNELLATNTYTLSETAPENVEIQLIFEYIAYSFEIKLVDEYFADDIDYGYTYTNGYNKLIVGTKLNLYAQTTKYSIVGWSWSATPKQDGYLFVASENATSDNQTIQSFAPISDDETHIYTLYLDVDYRYSSVNYSLKNNSIEQNVDYDTVAVDLSNKVIVFSDSENVLTSQQVEYLDTDITIDSTSNTTTIATTQFGNIVISGDTLTYTANGINVTSISKTDEDGVSVYSFNKYTYFGELFASTVEYLTLTQSVNNVTFTINGTTYGHNLVKIGEIQTVTTTAVYDDAKLAYQIDYAYSMYLYMNSDNTAYDYIELHGVKYYYDGEKFVLNNATINTPKDIECNSVKSATYSLQLSNLLPNTLVIYSTQSTNTSNYGFTSFTDKLGSNLGKIEYNNHMICMLNATDFDTLYVEYRKLENNITLRLNNESAYSYDNILFTVNGVSGSGKTIVATDNDIIIITISTDNISAGYKFDRYEFNTQTLSTDLVLQIVMDAKVYANQIIDIIFTEIEYKLNIYYIDKDTNIVNSSAANGRLVFEGQDECLTSTTVKLNNQYVFNAVANSGYYVGNAYIGTNAYQLLGLMETNDDENLVTKWTLSNDNFQQAIISNASDTNEVNLYIYFAIHTYSIKVYFNIAENASIINYPYLYINNIKGDLSVAPEAENGFISTKYYVEMGNFEYNSNVVCKLDNFMLGTSLQRWENAYGNQLSTSNEYTITTIDGDVVLKVVLQYVRYGLQFIATDEQGNQCNYGSASSNSATVKLFDTVNYTVNSTMGYVLKQKYYYNASNEIVTENIDSGFRFNPSNFKIEQGYVNIYLVFGLKSINLTISNSVEGKMYYFDGQDPQTLATFTVSRMRGNTNTTLNAETGYEFQTGDILTMEITPASIGVDISVIKLGSINITTLSNNSFYSLTPIAIYEQEQVKGVYYQLKIEFTSSIIDALQDEDKLENVLKVKVYNITYTYNFIDFKFGITLIRKYGNATVYGDEDSPLVIKNVGYGGAVNFSYLYEGMNTEISKKFRVDGFSIAGISQPAGSSFDLQDIALWEQLALKAHISNSHEITAVLLLSPKITLGNYTGYSLSTGYLYERTYIGAEQGLTTTGDNADVIVGEKFEVVIKYNSGAGYIDTLPINVGQYEVQIVAKISSSSSQTINVVFDEVVTYKITPALITVSLKTYSQTNPISKVYDGTNSLASTVIVNDIKLEGLFAKDQNQVFIDANKLSAKFSGSSVNTISTLHDISVFDISLLDASNNTITNYKLASGENLVFTQIGQITPKKLNITGFKVSNKVYDGTGNLVVNIDNINYVGKLESDSTQILNENLRFYLDDYSVGVAREVKLDWTNAVVGADSTNYTITYDTKYVDIHPYELTYTIKDYGTVKIVDADRLCLIPIGSEIIASVYSNGSSEYRNLYSIVEPEISKGEKLRVCYEVVLRVGVVNQLVPQGLYIYLPKVNKITKVLQVTDGNNVEKIEYLPQDEYTVVRVEQGEALFSIVTRTTYLPLWLIILIICLILLLLAILILIFILIRRKSKQKYSSYDKI